MPEQTHTPGPWKVSKCCIASPALPPGKWHHVAQVGLADDYDPQPLVADIHTRGVYHNSEAAALRADPEQLANARLIAAAPDLLEACKAAHAALSQNHTFPADIDAAKKWLADAIDKATA